MRELSISQWNRMWVAVPTGCRYQSKAGAACEYYLAERPAERNNYEVVRINAEGYSDMFGVVASACVDRMLA